MESIREILIKLFESPFLYIATIIVLFIFLKKGLLVVDTGPIKLGRTRELERRVISAQINFLTNHFSSISMKMERMFPDVNKYHTKYVVEKLLDACVRRVATNHIDSGTVYEDELVLELIDISRRRANRDYFFSKDFEDYVRDEAKTIISQLISIRARLSK